MIGTRWKFAVVVCFAIQAANAATISFYISAPGTQSTFVGGALTTTFNSLAPGNRTTNYTSLIGTYQLSAAAPFNIQNANQYGGAGGSRYMTFGAQSGTSAPITLQLNNDYAYFGFWWSAGDANNGLSFYDDTTFLMRFDTGTITSLLSPTTGTVTAIDNTVYANSSYYGNPNYSPRQNMAEPYAYVHVLASGLTFNRIVFDNTGLTSSGFESDNHSVTTNPVTMIGSAVLVDIVSIPEPGTSALLGIGLVLVAVGGRSFARR